MDFSHYSAAPVDMAVRLVNTLNVVTGQDELQSPGDLAGFIRQELSDRADVPAELSQRDLRTARTLRARLRSVWDAADAAGAAEAINAILADVGARPRVSVHGDDGPHLHFEPESADPLRVLGAITAMGLGTVLIEGGWDRFGTCGSRACDDVFIDTTKNRSRRHCSDTCTTRESVAAFRARQRTRE